TRSTVVCAVQVSLWGYVTGTRGDMFEDRIARYEAEGSKSWHATRAAGGATAATRSPSSSRSATPRDTTAEFAKRAQWNAPDLVKERVVPETREWVAKSAALQSLLEDYGAQITDDGRLVTKDGVLVPGVIVTEERPQTFSLRWANDGKRRVEVAYGNGMLNERLLDTPLPLVEDVEGGDDA